MDEIKSSDQNTSTYFLNNVDFYRKVINVENKGQNIMKK